MNAAFSQLQRLRARDPWDWIDRAASFLLLATLALRLPGMTLFPVVTFASILLLPSLVRSLAHSGFARCLGIASLAAIVVGLAQRSVIQPELGEAGPVAALAPLWGWVLSFPLIVLAGIWALRWWSVRQAATIVLAGAVAGELWLSSSLGWKGDLGLLLTMLALVVVPRNRPLLGIAVLLVSVILSITDDARSQAVFGLFVLVLFSTSPRLATFFRSRPKASILLVFAISIVLIWLVTLAMTEGLLGGEMQRRSLEQTSRGQSLIEGARAEWAITFELAAHSPLGYGTGVAVAGGIQASATEWFASVGGDYIGPYLRDSVFGERVDLHSILADLWFHFGIAGVAVAVIALALILRALPAWLAQQDNVGRMAAFALAVGAWDLFFSPMANLNRVGIALFLAAAILANERDRRQPGKVHVRGL